MTPAPAGAHTLVLLPGMDGSGALFVDFIAALGDAVAPVVVSYPPDLPLDYAALAAFAERHLPDRPFVLLGESFSGPVAIAIAAQRPPGLAGLVLCCTFARNPTPMFSPFKRLLGALPVSAALTGLVAPFLLGARSAPALRVALRAALADVGAPAMRERMRAVLEVDYSAQMRAIRVPVLYLQAAQDRVVLAGSARHLASLQPAMAVQRFQGPHLLLQTAPLETARAVIRFITSLA